MMDTEADTGLLVARAALAWAREAGWEATYVRRCYRSPDRLTEVYWSAGDRWLSLHKRQHLLDVEPLVVSVPVRSVREAVDVLAAYAVLPPQFSSAYGAGRASAVVSAWSREATEWRTVWPR